MKGITRELFHYYIACFALIGMLGGLVLSRALLSIAMIVLLINVLIQPGLKSNIHFLIKRPVLWLPMLLFIQTLVAFLNTSNVNTGTAWLQMKLPFLLLPLGIVSLKRIQKKHLIVILQLFIIVTWGSSFYVLYKYLAINHNVQYWRGDVMETPFSHIRYSLIICISVFTALYVFMNTRTAFRYASLVLGLWLLVFLHILAVRSGLVAFYLSTIALSLFYTIKNKKWLEGVALATAILIVPMLTYTFFPTLQQKFDYVSYDLKQYIKTGDATNLSDGQRLLSLKMGWNTFRENLWFGVGTGDIEDEMNLRYDQSQNQNIESSRRLPHNQWLWTAVCGGVVGLGLLASGLLIPIWLLRKRLNWFFIAFLIILHSSMMTEATIESQIGVALYIIFYLLNILMILQDDGD